MRVGIYAETIKESQPRGIGLYVLNLINALASQDKSNEYLLYFQHDLFRTVFDCARLVKADNIVLRPVRYPRALMDRYPRLWWDFHLPNCIKWDRLDVFHGPNHFVPAVSSVGTVLTIHDLAYFKMQLYSPAMTAAYREWTLKSLRRATRVIAISESTRRDIDALGIPAEKVALVYSGGGSAISQRSNVSGDTTGLSLPERFILFVGTLHPRKNIPFLVRAFAKLKQAGFPHSLVLAGKPDSATAEIEQAITELGIRNDVVITGYLPDEAIRSLYAKADLFVLPSRYEGFGMIIQEAMACGVPVIAANTSSLPEVVGDAGLLVSPDDVVELAHAMQRLLTDTELRNECTRRGRLQAQRFTWERCASEMRQVYVELSACAF
jgi:glycosyltransferase involved in cell wall biosynthesis